VQHQSSLKQTERLRATHKDMKSNWKIVAGLTLIILSTAFYYLHYFIFRDAHHIFIYLIGDIAFLFLDVLIVILVLHRLLEYREKQSMLKKLNMVIGMFFNEMGSDLLKKCSHFDPNLVSLQKKLIIKKDWEEKNFYHAKNNLHEQTIHVSRKNIDNLSLLKKFLIQKRPFLLNLLANPNLLEHDTFTDTLWAIFHLTEELSLRTHPEALPDTDYQHLAGDIKRAYERTILQWLDYMQHLRQDYPYLFSLAMRTNPFDESALVEVR
jgi:hypothetical protein